MEIDTKRIEDAVVAEVADKMIGEEDLYNRAKRAIDARIDKIWSEVVEERVTSAITHAISDGFEREYQKIDSFGSPRGAKTTIRAELERLIGGYWTESVDSQGKPSNSNYGTTSRAEWFMTKLVADDFSKVMKQHMVNVGGALKDSLRKEMFGTVNKLLSEVFHVKTPDDKTPGRHIIDPPVGPVTAA